MNKRRQPFGYILVLILVSISHGCIRHYVTIERTVNAVWNAGNTEILKVVSTYETYDPDEKFYYATSGRNWKYRFEKCSPDLSMIEVIGTAGDIKQGGTFQYVPVYWLSASQRLLVNNTMAQTVLMDMQGNESILEPPADVIDAIFIHNPDNRSCRDYAPSPDEKVIAVYFQSAYYTSSNYIDFSYDHCISFFEAGTGKHLFSQSIPFEKIDPALNVVGQHHNRRCQFVWSADGTGVYIVTRDQSFFIRYGPHAGIQNATFVPERGNITKAGTISNTGIQLLITENGNETMLDFVQLTDWKPIDSLQLIRREENTYSFY